MATPDHGLPYDNQVKTFLEALTDALPSTTEIVHEQGCWVIGEGTWRFENAIAAATAADVAILFVGR